MSVVFEDAADEVIDILLAEALGTHNLVAACPQDVESIS